MLAFSVLIIGTLRVVMAAGIGMVVTPIRVIATLGLTAAGAATRRTLCKVERVTTNYLYDVKRQSENSKNLPGKSHEASQRCKWVALHRPDQHGRHDYSLYGRNSKWVRIANAK
jgi:hypothetical protein